MSGHFIIGLLIGGAAVGIGAAFYKERKKYADVTRVSDSDSSDFVDSEDDVKEEPKTFKEKVEAVILKATEKVVEYKEKIDAATFLVGLMTASVGFVGSVLNLRKGLKKEETPTNYYFLVPDKSYATPDHMERLVDELKEDRRILS